MNTPLKKLDKWDMSIKEFDYIYIVPTKQKRDDTNYNIGYYLGTIGNETKIIQAYDCGHNFNMDTNAGTALHWDFECPYGQGGIKIWNFSRGKIKYEYGGRLY